MTTNIKSRNEVEVEVEERYKSVYERYPDFKESHAILLSDFKETIHSLRASDIKTLMERVDRIDDNGGGSGRRLKIQFKSLLEESLRRINGDNT